MTKRGYRPGDLRQEMNRIRLSRDNLKNMNREKAAANKKIRDRNAELDKSRDQWKERSKDLDRQLQTALEEAEFERVRADKERERANKLEAEIEEVWGKKSRA
jgi:chromosome segregation ATPase